MTDAETPDAALLANPVAFMDAAAQAVAQAPAAAVLGSGDASQSNSSLAAAPPGDPAAVLSQNATGDRAKGLSADWTNADQALVVQQISRIQKVADKPFVISPDAEGVVMDLVKQVAAARGVTPPLQLKVLNVETLKLPEPDAELAARSGTTADDWRALWLAQAVWAAVLKVVGTVSGEWQDLQDTPIGQSFQNLAAEKKTDPFAYYQQIRSLMYSQGWANQSDPYTAFWTQIVPATLCGVNITYGVHPIFLKALQGDGSDPDLPQPSQNPDLTQPSNIWQPAKADVVLGFQAKVIRKGPQLSNHAFGLAIDISAEQNPIISEPTEIRIVRDHTSQHIDLGKELDKAALPALVDKVHQAAHDYQDWLKAAVPKEQSLRDTREADGETLRKAQATGDQAAIASAQADYDAAVAAYDNDPLVPADVAALRKVIGDVGISQREKNGFLNLPLTLIDALTAPVAEGGPARFRWGGAYVKLKDFMHFEIDAKDVFGNI